MAFSNVIIGGIIILGCLAVFMLMAAVVVTTKKNTPSFEITITEHDNAEQVRAASKHLNEWATVVNMHDSDKVERETLVEIISGKMAELAEAIDHEDYESAAVLRDEINELNVELKNIKNV